MKKYIFLTALLLFFASITLKAQSPTLQEVMDNGNETTTALKYSHVSGIQIQNPNITVGYNSILFGQSGTSNQFMRLVPFSTFDNSFLWGNSLYFDLINQFWGVKGDFLFEGVPQFNKAIVLNQGSGNGADFGLNWKAYVNVSDDEWLFTKAGTSGAELKIKNIDGNYKNSHFLIGGKVGIGIGTPLANLHLHGQGGGNSGFRISNSSDVVRGYLDSDINNANFVITYDNTGNAEIELQADGDVILAQAGNVGIGTTTPSEKLEVNGTIRSKEVKVEASPWPDYVFSPTYHLRSLEETEAFIQANSHLPEMPSAEEVAENGIELGVMNMLLLKKIEELTLHTIQQQKMLEKQEQAIENLKTKMNTLTNSEE